MVVYARIFKLVADITSEIKVFLFYIRSRKAVEMLETVATSIWKTVCIPMWRDRLCGMKNTNLFARETLFGNPWQIFSFQ